MLIHTATQLLHRLISCGIARMLKFWGRSMLIRAFLMPAKSCLLPYFLGADVTISKTATVVNYVQTCLSMFGRTESLQFQRVR